MFFHEFLLRNLMKSLIFYLMIVQFAPGSSWIYRTNPLVKGGVAFSLILFFTVSKVKLLGLVLLISFMAILFKTCKVPQLAVWFSLKRIWVLLLLIGLVQGFRFGDFDALYAVEAMGKILGVFVVAGMYLTISPQGELMYFWEKVFAPFSVVGVPSREMALVMVIAVRFFPVMLSEIDRIRMSQIARGAKLRTGGLLTSAISLMPLMIPTLTQAIVRAEELADAMEARGYRVATRRTRYTKFLFNILDLVCIISVSLMLILVLKLGI